MTSKRLEEAPVVLFDEFDQGRSAGEAALHFRSAGEGSTVVLLHGWPQHSLMWHTVAPLLAGHHRVVCPDLRGAGASSVLASGYDKTTLARDVVDLLDDLGEERVDLVGYDLGAGVAAAVARDHPERVRRLALAEFALAGFGYEDQMAPRPEWDVAANWHLGLFTVPDAALFLCAGRERELLGWFFAHLSYQGLSAIDAAHLEAYIAEVSKPGALRAGIAWYAAVWQDARDNAVLSDRPLSMPVLAVGGEASSGPALQQIWGPVTTDLQTFVVPQAGHWLGDENPWAVADALLGFFVTGGEGT